MSKNVYCETIQERIVWIIRRVGAEQLFSSPTQRDCIHVTKNVSPVARQRTLVVSPWRRTRACFNKPSRFLQPYTVITSLTLITIATDVDVAITSQFIDEFSRNMSATHLRKPLNFVILPLSRITTAQLSCMCLHTLDCVIITEYFAYSVSSTGTCQVHCSATSATIKYLYFWRYPNSLPTQCTRKAEGTSNMCTTRWAYAAPRAVSSATAETSLIHSLICLITHVSRWWCGF